jgi:hypothetical protein
MTSLVRSAAFELMSMMSSWPLLDDVIGLTLHALGTAQHDVTVQRSRGDVKMVGDRVGRIDAIRTKNSYCDPYKVILELPVLIWHTQR